jgi:hypothetical protein
MQGKNIVIAVLVLVLLGAVGFLFINSNNSSEEPDIETTPTEQPDEPMPVEPDGGIGDGAEPLPEPDNTSTDVRGSESDLGESVNGTTITAYHFGTGGTEVLLVGGVHGGYSPNTAKLANDLVSYYESNESELPDNIMLTIIPNLNPDGARESGAEGRFNANTVDLNRNFDCEWSESGTWQNREVSGGSAPFSEPEAQALRDYVLEYEPAAAVVWFSAEGKVYPSACAGTPSQESVELAATFATAAGYPAEAEFDAYAITGDMVNWMAKEGIPAISVLLSDYTDTEESKNLAGLKAILDKYAE